MKTFDLGPVTAYALAVKNGFKGTEQEWLTSLVPNLSIGEVKTLEAGSDAAAAISGTPEKPVLNLSLPRGENGCAADWDQNDPARPDYVKNRTHYEDENGVVVPLPAKYLPVSVPYVEDAGMVEILPETQVAAQEDSELTLPALSVAAGETYTVKWNGTEYICVAMDGADLGEPGIVVLGDVYTLTDGGIGTESTGEPFALLVIPGMGTFVMPFEWAEGEPLPTVAIYSNGTEIHKLDNRCLDLEWLPLNHYEPIIEQKTLVFDTMNSAGAYLAAIDLVPLVDGQRVRVDFDGVRYNSVAVADGNGAFCVGNGSIVNFGTNTGEPFALVFNTVQKLAVVYTYKQGACAFAMYNLEPNKLPKEFLPTDATELYLTSSGGKRFKITVSDDGALSAAEVTD